MALISSSVWVYTTECCCERNVQRWYWALVDDWIDAHSITRSDRITLVAVQHTRIAIELISRLHCCVRAAQLFN